jgi:hypothetical protein
MDIKAPQLIMTMLFSYQPKQKTKQKPITPFHPVPFDRVSILRMEKTDR